MALQAPEARVIPANEYRRTRWRNGCGWTREILAWPQVPDWGWRVSIAEIEQAAPFSRFPGVDREQVLLEGDGLRLRFDDAEERVLQPPHGGARYAGDRGVTGEPLGARAVVFNLMWRRDALAAELWRRPLVGPMLFFADPGEHWLLYLLAGQARFEASVGLPDLAQGDSAVLGGGERRRYLLEGGGELLVARLR